MTRFSRSPLRLIHLLAPLALAAMLLPALAGQAQAQEDEPILIGQNFWAVPWGGSDPFQPGFRDVEGPDPFKPGFIEEVTPYHIIRFMDWNHTNSHVGEKEGFQVDDFEWMSRKQKDDPNQMLVAYEWQVDAANRTNSHGWFNVPEGVNADYCLRLAILVKTGVDMLDIDLAPYQGKLDTMTAEDFVEAGGKQTGDPLAEHLRAYLEFSNETWLFQWDDMKRLGEEMGLGPNEYHAYMSVRLFDAFEQVFGEDSERIRTVMAGQAGNWWHGDKRLEPIYDENHPRHDVINPGLIDGVDAYAIATYWGESPREQLDRWLKHKSKVVDKYDVDFYFYEGGNGDAMPKGGVGLGPVKDPAMYDAYEVYFRTLREAGFTEGCHYMHSGGREWACIPENGVGIDRAREYSKYRALVDHAAKTPLPGEGE
ncbi:MAG: hypothetical protein ACLFV3_09025 [Phycisphaeraceae bacterium]